jgi:hypothetical protein
MREEPVDERWRALWIDSDGDLRLTKLERAGDMDFERPDTVFACGQGSALVLVERYLHHASFFHDSARAIKLGIMARTAMYETIHQQINSL